MSESNNESNQSNQDGPEEMDVEEEVEEVVEDDVVEEESPKSPEGKGKLVIEPELQPKAEIKRIEREAAARALATKGAKKERPVEIKKEQASDEEEDIPLATLAKKQAQKKRQLKKPVDVEEEEEDEEVDVQENIERSRDAILREFNEEQRKIFEGIWFTKADIKDSSLSDQEKEAMIKTVKQIVDLDPVIREGAMQGATDVIKKQVQRRLKNLEHVTSYENSMKEEEQRKKKREMQVVQFREQYFEQTTLCRFYFDQINECRNVKEKAELLIKIQREDWPCGKEMTDGIPVELSFGAQKDAQEFLDADVAGLFEQMILAMLKSRDDKAQRKLAHSLLDTIADKHTHYVGQNAEGNEFVRTVTYEVEKYQDKNNKKYKQRATKREGRLKDLIKKSKNPASASTKKKTVKRAKVANDAKSGEEEEQEHKPKIIKRRAIEAKIEAKK